ncbi:alpha/beta hydrolase [Microbacterium terrae]|nr:alpha/beta hydrolase [Microbacterium terrae]
MAVAALVVVVWVCVTEWGGVVHGHPAYAIALAATALGAVGFGAIALLRRVRRGVWRVIGRVALIVLAAVWVGAIAWMRPHTAVEPALSAMESDSAVTVTETATRIVLEPTGAGDDTAVFFQPGALVDPRAYAAVLRPVAEAGHTVVITKQPFGIAFFSLGDFSAVLAEHPDERAWVVGGHSLGGTVAAIQASGDEASAAAGLLFYASYPADDIRDSLTAAVLSISGSQDGLATPEKIDASRGNLPQDAAFLQIEGASHAQFGDYGPQSGDGEPEISHDDARAQISAASVEFVDAVSE